VIPVPQPKNQHSVDKLDNNFSQTENVSFLGCPVSRLSVPQTLEWMEAAIAKRKPCQIAVVNANKFYLMSRDARLREIVRHSALVVPEWAVVWGARKLGLPSLNHSGGILLAQKFIPYAARKGFRIYLLGARQETVEALVSKLESDHPQLVIAGYHDGYLATPEIEASVIEDVRRSRPDVLFVALGSPKQELWIDANMKALDVPVSMGVGGSFDVLSGLKQDAPEWVRGKGLEWLYRITQNPGAYTKRYLVTNSWFVWQVLKAKLKTRIPFK
jgi:N-acetylglucosaminyldiphosphoundecaprenol N-acetyl-beta-D-mannosaminyltransferase